MRGLVVGAVFLLAGLEPAHATDVTFSGTLAGVCTLALPTPGVLGLAADGSLSSTAGIPAVLSILSVGTNTVTINPPTWVSSPVAYVASGESLQVSYAGIGGLSLINQAFTSSITTFGINTLPLTLLTVNAKAVNANNGFPAGTYQMKVVVTCS